MDWCRHDGIEFNIDLVSLYLLLFPIQQHKFCCQLIIALYRSNNDLKPSGALALASYFTALTSLQMLDLKWGLLYCVCLVSFYIQVSPWSCEITPANANILRKLTDSVPLPYANSLNTPFASIVTSTQSYWDCFNISIFSRPFTALISWNES